MKTARERAEDWLKSYIGFGDKELVDNLEALLKEQDKITRHVCAEAVSDKKIICEAPIGCKSILPNEARMACINCLGGI